MGWCGRYFRIVCWNWERSVKIPGGIGGGGEVDRSVGGWLLEDRGGIRRGISWVGV